MARITSLQLRDRCAACARVLSLEPEELWLQRSATGWHCYRRAGSGARPLAECLTASQMLAFLDGLYIGSDFPSPNAL